MFDHLLRVWKEQLMAPLAALLGTRLGMSAMSVTYLSGVVGVLSAFCGYLGHFQTGFVLWIVSRILDGVDGTIARAKGTQSDLGGYADLMVDHVCYLLVPFAMTLHNPSDLSLRLALEALLGSYFLNSVGLWVLSSILEKRNAGAKARGELTSVSMPFGIVEGAETVVVYSLFFLMPNRTALLFWSFAIAVYANVIVRWVWAHKNIQDPSPSSLEKAKKK